MSFRKERSQYMFNAIYIWLAILGNNSYLHSCWFFLSEDSINITNWTINKQNNLT
jgi:hypothetical protein